MLTLQCSEVRIVVYFDQQMHACPCVCMVETNKKCSKIIKNILFSSFVQKAHVSLTYKNEQNRAFYCFWPCEHIRKHAFAGRNVSNLKTHNSLKTILNCYCFIFCACICCTVCTRHEKTCEGETKNIFFLLKYTTPDCTLVCI